MQRPGKHNCQLQLRICNCPTATAQLPNCNGLVADFAEGTRILHLIYPRGFRAEAVIGFWSFSTRKDLSPQRPLGEPSALANCNSSSLISRERARILLLIHPRSFRAIRDKAFAVFFS
ncbi:MAG: hypothetical protein ABI625_07155 [bacterium]